MTKNDYPYSFSPWKGLKNIIRASFLFAISFVVVFSLISSFTKAIQGVAVLVLGIFIIYKMRTILKAIAGRFFNPLKENIKEAGLVNFVIYSVIPIYVIGQVLIGIRDAFRKESTIETDETIEAKETPAVTINTDADVFDTQIEAEVLTNVLHADGLIRDFTVDSNP